MRLPFRRCRALRPPDLLLLLALATISPTTALDFKPASAANLDLSNLGEVVIAGDFSGISLYQYHGQTSADLSTNGSQSLLARLPNGVLAPVAATDATIQSMCALRRKNGNLDTVVIGGNFTSLDGIESTAVALFNPTTSEFKPLSGLEGQVSALYCDQDRELVYIGGSFHAANSTNALAWSASNGFVDLPFAGFNGPVDAITKSSNGHIIFGGNFTGLGNTSTPSRPDEQVINLSTANTTATNSASIPGFSDPKSLACSGGSDGSGRTWLLADKTPGTWDANFGYVFQPTKLRLWNTRHEGRGTKTFRFLAFPINGIMNLTYVDPATGQNTTCTSECPLSHDAKIAFQDFHFVNRVGMNSFQIAISDWYGNGAGLAGIQLFHNDIYAYAISDFNEPTCGGNKFPSKATATGPWQHSPSVQSNAEYLTASLTSSSPPDKLPAVIFYPSIRESGNYSINMYTPGCMPDETCQTRGRVNVTGTMSSGTANVGFSTVLYQTNNYDKYDQIYFGYVEKTSSSFQPSVTITPLPGQEMPVLTVVAQRIGFTLVNSTGGLNGLFDFNPDNDTVDVTKFEQSPVNKLGSGFKRSSGVSSLASSGDVVYIGGDFTSDGQANMVAIGGPNNEVQSLDGGGLNGKVLDMHLEDGKLYVGGDFTDKGAATQDGLNHVAVFDTRASKWSALGAGVDGRVQHVVPLVINMTAEATETAIALSGVFSECRRFGDNPPIPVDGFAVWVPSKGNWLQNVEGSHPAYNGMLTAAVVDLPNNDKLFAGSMESAQVGANGAATLGDKGLGSLPSVNLMEASPASRRSRRDELSDGARGVVTGTFYDNGDANVTVLAGHFTARAKDGSTIENLVFIDGAKGGAVSGLGPGVSATSTFTTVAMRGSVLYAGGRVSGTVADRPVGGIVAYDMKSKSFGNQPAPVSGGKGTVSAVTIRPNTAEVYVAGSFQKAGALDCPAVCLYNADSDQWMQPGNGLSGEVSCMMWSSDSTLLAGGDMRSNGSDRQYLASFNVKRQAWMSFPGAEGIPGPVQVMTAASSDGNQVWIAGKSAEDASVFLMKFDGSRWKKAAQGLPAQTVLRSLQVFTLTKSHGKTEMLDDKQGLMLTGSMDLPGIGPVSAVLYNGTDFLPYTLTTHSGAGAGSVGKIFTQRDDFFTSGKGHMPLVFVVLIGLAIALGIILLMVLAGIALDRLRKKREGYTRAPTSMHDRGSGIQRIPPRELLESLGKVRPGAPHV